MFNQKLKKTKIFFNKFNPILTFRVHEKINKRKKKEKRN